MELTQKEWFIQVPWGRLSVVAWGSCLDPPVLLVHGVGDNAASFAPLVKLLPPKFYYIAMELPGVGKSDRLPPGLMLTTYDLVAVIDVVSKHFRWESFRYIGHGLGAVLGKLFNHSVPDKIIKLIELDPINFVGVEPGAFADWYHTYFTDYYKNYRAYNKPKEKGEKCSREEAINKLVKKRGISSEIASSIVDRATERTNDGYLRNITDPRHTAIPPPPLSSEYIRTNFLNTKVPTLHVISTESHDKQLFRNTSFLQDESSYTNRNYRCVKVEGSHDFHLQCPEKMADAVGRFLIGDVKAKL